MNYIAFDSYTGEVDFVNAETMKAMERTSEPGRYSFHEEPNFDWLEWRRLTTTIFGLPGKKKFPAGG